MVLSTLVFFLMACSGKMDRENVVAQVNQRSLAVRDLEERMMRVNIFPNKDWDNVEGRMALLKQMVDEELIFQAAVKAEVHLRSSEIKRALVREYLTERFGKDVRPISEDEIKKLWNEKRSQIEKVNAKQLYFPLEAADQARRVVADMKKELALGGTLDFDRYIQTHAQDKVARIKSGSLGFVSRDQLPYVISSKLFKIEKLGDVSELIEHEDGFYIFQLTGDRRGFEKNRADVRAYLMNEEKKKLATAWLNTLREKAKIQLHAEMLDKAKAPLPYESLPAEAP